MPTPRPRGWHVELDHPDGQTLTPSLVDDPRYLPTVNGLPEVILPVPRDEKYQQPAFEDAPMRVWKDGRRLPIEQLRDVSVRPGHAELTGVGGVELLGRTRISTSGETTADVARDIVAETSYVADIDDTQLNEFPDQRQYAATNTSIRDLLGGEQQPLAVTPEGEIRLARTASVVEGESFSEASGGSVRVIYTGGDA